jgi:DNA polymerase III subunit delta
VTILGPVAEEALRPVYLLTGSDRPKIRRALARLRGRFPVEAVEHLSVDTASGADAVAACNALGLFGADGSRLVVVDGVERWRSDDVDAVSAYLADPAAGAVLALVTEATPRTQALASAAASAGEVLKFDVPKPRDPSVWVRAEFERLGAPVEADAARALVEVVGDDVSELAGEVEKLVTWAAGEPIGRREVELLAVPAGETFVWALTDAWGSRDLPRLLEACEALLERRTREPFGIAAALAAYVGRIRAAQALTAEGLGAADVARRLKIKDYPARKAIAHARNFAPDELDSALVRLADLDAALKGDSRLAAELELERALVETARPREPVERA